MPLSDCGVVALDYRGEKGIALGDEPNICSTARSNGRTPSACWKAKRWSPVVSPTTYIGDYRIGLGGGSVSSVDTGRYSSGIELNAVQRANAEMQKRANNVVRALCSAFHNDVLRFCLSYMSWEMNRTSVLPLSDTLRKQHWPIRLPVLYFLYPKH